MCALALALSFLVGSQFAHAVEPHPKPLLGQWGGAGIDLFVTENGADGGFNCSTGRIDGPITVDNDGNFCVTGSMDYWYGTPQLPEHLPATFSGHIQGRDMHLIVHMPGQQDANWTFDAKRDVKGQTYQCVQ